MHWKYLLFDLDGTLTDPMQGITRSVQYALRHFGIEVEDLTTLCPFIGPPLRDSFREFYGMTSAQADEASEKYGEYFSRQGIFETSSTREFPNCCPPCRRRVRRWPSPPPNPTFWPNGSPGISGSATVSRSSAAERPMVPARPKRA